MTTLTTDQLAELKRLAQATKNHTRDPESHPDVEGAFIAACSPDVVLALAERAGALDNAMQMALASAEAECAELRARVAELSALNEELQEDNAEAHERQYQSDKRVADLEAVLAIHEQDAKDAAGELMLELPEPGSVMAKLMIVNRLLKYERDAAREEGRKEGREAERAAVLALLSQRAAMADALVRFGGNGGGVLRGVAEEIERGEQEAGDV